MAVAAILAQQIGGCAAGWCAQATFSVAWVEWRYMALLAKPGGAGLQQGLVVAAVRLVAVAAVFSNRCMFP